MSDYALVQDGDTFAAEVQGWLVREWTTLSVPGEGTQIWSSEDCMPFRDVVEIVVTMDEQFGHVVRPKSVTERVFRWTWERLHESGGRTTQTVWAEKI